MKLTEDITEQLIHLGLKELWEHFTLLEGEYEDYDLDYKEIKYGTGPCRIIIYDLVNEKYTEKPKENKIVYRIPGTTKLESVSSELFEEEKEKRMAKLRTAIYENTETTMTTSPRTQEEY